MKLNVKAFALTTSLIWGIGLFCITWWVIIFEGATDGPTTLSHIYRGYSLSAIGSLIGLVWGLVDGLIGGFIFAWLYNPLAGRFSTKVTAPSQ
jgi:hypothetical protein